MFSDLFSYPEAHWDILSAKHLALWKMNWYRSLYLLIALEKKKKKRKMYPSSRPMLCLGWCYLKQESILYWKDKSCDSLKGSKEEQKWRKRVRLRTNYVSLPCTKILIRYNSSVKSDTYALCCSFVFHEWIDWKGNVVFFPCWKQQGNCSKVSSQGSQSPGKQLDRIINGQKCMQVKVHNAEKQLPDKQLSGG